MKIIRRLAIGAAVLLGILLMSGCGSAPKAESVVGTQATLTVTEPTISPSHPPLPSPTGNIPLTPTETIETKTPTCAKFIIEKKSPDGNWNAGNCEFDSENASLIITANSGKYWQLLAADYLPFGTLWPEAWSKDNQYLFFTSNINWEGYGTCFYGFGAQGLFRLDVESGKTSPVLPLLRLNDPDGYLISFAPTVRRFVYSRGQNNLYVHDLLTGKEVMIETDELNGSFQWSPDGTSLAFSTSKCEQTAQGVIRSTVKVLNMSDLSTRIIAQSNDQFLTINDWNEENLLVVGSLNYKTNVTTLLSFDLQQNKMIATAIATP